MTLSSLRRFTGPAVAVTATLLATVLPAGAASAVAPPGATVFINEIHYDNDGGDVGEFIEVAGPVGTDLTDWSVVLYNGSGGATYGTRLLSGAVPAAGVVVLDYPANGLQNGSPDGIALVDAAGTLVQFLSYEGQLTAVGGPAASSNSTDIGVTEAGSTPVGQSLQLTGSGSTYGDFTWTGPATATKGAPNTGQTLGSTGGGGTDPDPDPEPEPAPLTKISTVQGSGPASPLVGERVTVEAVVTAVKTSRDEVVSYFLQEQDADADPATSEGLLVRCEATCPSDLSAGDVVRAVGTVQEFFAMTRLDATAGTSTVVATGAARPTPAVETLPAETPTTDAATFESSEGMLTTFPTTLSVSEFFALARFGEVVLSAGGRPYQYTHVATPDPVGYADYLVELEKRRITLDDGSEDQNDATSGSTDEPYPFPTGGLSTTNRFRGGDTITGLTGVLEYSFGTWRVQPAFGETYDFTSANPRTTAPEEVGGRLTVSSFNVLNYFATIDETSSRSKGPCGPSGTQDCRGADSESERERQLAKIVAAMKAIDADVLGLIEIENDEGQATQQIVAALNAATAPGTYDYVRTGAIGTDAIKQAFLYQPATVTPVGAFQTLDTKDDERFLDTKNRPAVVQTFAEVATGEKVTVALNHFKSKGSSCNDVDDPDKNDGAANCDGTRTAAAEALRDFLATDPTGSGDPDFLVIGDLNSYRNERPITTLEAAGYTDLIEEFGGDKAYGYLFGGQLGYLDHALATAPLVPQVTGATEWHINADEPIEFDYNDTVNDVGESSFERRSTALPLYEANPYRSSDHDPVIVGLDLASNEAPVADAGGPYVVSPGRTVGLDAGGSTDADGDTLTYAWDLDDDGAFDDATGRTAQFRGNRPPGDYAVSVQVSDGEFTSTDRTTVSVVPPGKSKNKNENKGKGK